MRPEHAEKIEARQTNPLRDILNYFFRPGSSDLSREREAKEIIFAAGPATLKAGHDIFIQSNGETAFLTIIKIQFALELVRRNLEIGLTPEEKFNLGRMLQVTRDETMRLAQDYIEFVIEEEAKEHGTDED